jgi:hypothetical protein
MVEAKATPDVSYAAIKAFLDDLNTLKSALPQQPAGGSPAGGAAPGVDPCASTTNCDRLNCRIKIAYKALTAPDLTPSDLQKIITEANGFAGVTTAANDLANAQAQIDNNVKAARDGLEKIRTDFGSLPQAGPAQCPQVTGQILVDYLDVHSTAGQIIAKKEALKKDLGDLVTILQPYLQQNVWRGPTFSDYEIRTVNPTFTEQQAVSVTAKARTVQLVSSTIVIKTDDANLISTKFDVRKSALPQ